MNSTAMSILVHTSFSAQMCTFLPNVYLGGQLLCHRICIRSLDYFIFLTAKELSESDYTSAHSQQQPMGILTVFIRSNRGILKQGF